MFISSHRALRSYSQRNLVSVCSMEWYKIVMQHFFVIYHGNATRHLYFLGIHTRLKARVYRENSSDSWDIPWYTTRKRCITIIYIAHITYLYLSHATFLKHRIDFPQSGTSPKVIYTRNSLTHPWIFHDYILLPGVRRIETIYLKSFSVFRIY